MLGYCKIWKHHLKRKYLVYYLPLILPVLNGNGRLELMKQGRGPLFGRVYTAAVVLPKEGENTNFQYHLLKDSKNFSSKKKN